MATIADDAKLQARIEALLLDDAAPPEAQPTTGPPPQLPSAETSTHPSLSIEEQIKTLRHQLNKSHAAFTGARDSLERISFVGIGQQLRRQAERDMVQPASGDGDDDVDADVLSAASTAGDETHPGTTSAKLAAQLQRHYRSASDVPQLGQFFSIVGDLQTAVEGMEWTHGAWANLQSEVQQSLQQNGEFVTQMREYVDAAAEESGVSAAEKLATEQMVDAELAKTNMK